MVRGRRANFIIIGTLAIISLLILSYNYDSLPRTKLSLDSLPSSLRSKPKGPQYAYATFLSSRPEGNITEDSYVLATRVLAYQLLHHPVTKTTKNIPFLVIVPPHVPESIHELLTKEGATVIQVQNLVPATWEPSPGMARWIDQFTKLRLFELTEYDRILYMDNDMLITRSLDPIWDEEEVTLERVTKNSTEHIQPDEGERPAKISQHSRLNGGFFIFRPDEALFNYYKSVLEFGQAGRFDAGMMEMGLLNYAHRFEGNMPWVPLEPGKWSSNWPSYRDFERGAASLHDKFWDPANINWIDRRLVEMWWRVQGQMEGFWQAKDNSILGF
ncbi:nucleotide-diphospho-sugar transferase [Microthyrium microscopicum]|uniref:Nucleotide-diphospho-sugar transferase n=1 Tax=Microthyrium microscopicum TaxID=703497 RepID=A0A6A6U0L0_9PEZI|nr:nucleotide-diphospho-sugar transferase [Microthyrium microscopicum]